MTLKGWMNDLQHYIQIVKDAELNTKIKDLPSKKSLEFPYFGIRPKTDQNRVQCEVKLNELLPLLKINVDYTKFEGAKINDNSEYPSKIKSAPRDRGGITIKILKEYCISHNIKGYSKNKADLIQHIINTKHDQNNEFIEKITNL